MLTRSSSILCTWGVEVQSTVRWKLLSAAERTKQFYSGTGKGKWMNAILLLSVFDPILVAVMVWIGKHRGFTVRSYVENKKCVMTSQRAVGEDSLFHATTVFLVQILLNCGLSGWKKLILSVKHERRRYTKKDVKVCSWREQRWSGFSHKLTVC